MSNAQGLSGFGHWTFLVGSFFLPFLFTLLVQHDPFFWDGIQLASKHAHFFYANGLRWELLPTEIDSGHPPLLGYYIACCWTVFGKSLPVGHWTMFPFLWATVALLLRLGRQLGGADWAMWFLPLALLDPVFGGQAALVAPDILLACFFLMTWSGLLSDPDGGGRNAPNTALVLLGCLGLCAVSMRGMMTAFALFAYVCIRDGNRIFSREKWLFLPGFALGLTFLAWHWAVSGWIGFHADSPWASAFEPASGASVLRNAAILAWRWLDFGRFAVWGLVAVLAYVAWRRDKGAFPRQGGLLLGCMVVLLSWSALRYQNLNAHRYFLPCFLAFHGFAFQWLVRQDCPILRKKIALVVLYVALALGHLQRYPEGISMDWDCTLAHRSYHALRAEALAFLDARGVERSQVGTAFPNLNTGEDIALDGDLRRFAAMNLDSNRCVLVSNVFNDVSKADMERLRRSWRRIFHNQRGTVTVEVFER
jgi:hypothetical protein